MEEITSRSNALVKLARSLAGSARDRREQGLTLLEGQRLCCDAALSGAVIAHALVTPQAAARLGDKLQPLLAAAQDCCTISESVAQSLAQTQNNQGVFALCRIPEHRLPDFSQGGSWLLLDHLQDPGNLGTMVRCAEAFGIAAVVLSPDCADLWSPKVLRGTMGSAFRQPVVTVPDLVATVAELRAAGVACYAAALQSGAVPPAAMQPGSCGTAVVVGNEGAGVSDAVLAACDHQVYIPMSARIESLNAATAAAVLLWEISGRGEAAKR